MNVSMTAVDVAGPLLVGMFLFMIMVGAIWLYLSFELKNRIVCLGNRIEDAFENPRGIWHNLTVITRRILRKTDP